MTVFKSIIKRLMFVLLAIIILNSIIFSCFNNPIEAKAIKYGEELTDEIKDLLNNAPRSPGVTLFPIYNRQTSAADIDNIRGGSRNAAYGDKAYDSDYFGLFKMNEKDIECMERFANEHFTPDMDVATRLWTVWKYIHEETHYAVNGCRFGWPGCSKPHWDDTEGKSYIWMCMEENAAQCNGYNGAMCAWLCYFGFEAYEVRYYTSGQHYWCECVINGTRYYVETGNQKKNGDGWQYFFSPADTGPHNYTHFKGNTDPFPYTDPNGQSWTLADHTNPFTPDVEPKTSIIGTQSYTTRDGKVVTPSGDISSQSAQSNNNSSSDSEGIEGTNKYSDTILRKVYYMLRHPVKAIGNLLAGLCQLVHNALAVGKTGNVFTISWLLNWDYFKKILKPYMITTAIIVTVALLYRYLRHMVTVGDNLFSLIRDSGIYISIVLLPIMILTFVGNCFEGITSVITRDLTGKIALVETNYKEFDYKVPDVSVKSEGEQYQETETTSTTDNSESELDKIASAWNLVDDESIGQYIFRESFLNGENGTSYEFSTVKMPVSYNETTHEIVYEDVTLKELYNSVSYKTFLNEMVDSRKTVIDGDTGSIPRTADRNKYVELNETESETESVTETTSEEVTELVTETETETLSIFDDASDLTDDDVSSLNIDKGAPKFLYYSKDRFVPVHYDKYDKSIFYYFYDWIKYQYLAYWSSDRGSESNSILDFTNCYTLPGEEPYPLAKELIENKEKIDEAKKEAQIKAIASQKQPLINNQNGNVTTEQSGVVKTSDATIYKGKCYNLTEKQLKQLAYVCKREQGGDEWGTRFEASQICNLFEYKSGTGSTKYTDITSYVLYGGWYAHASTGQQLEDEQIIGWVRDVIVNGNRVCPPCVIEHDCMSDIVRITGPGSSSWNKKEFVTGETVLYNCYGGKWTFYGFPGGDTRNDPFGYTEKSLKFTGGIAPTPGDPQIKASANFNNIGFIQNLKNITFNKSTYLLTNSVNDSNMYMLEEPNVYPNVTEEPTQDITEPVQDTTEPVTTEQSTEQEPVETETSSIGEYLDYNQYRTMIEVVEENYFSTANSGFRDMYQDTTYTRSDSIYYNDIFGLSNLFNMTVEDDDTNFYDEPDNIYKTSKTLNVWANVEKANYINTMPTFDEFAEGVSKQGDYSHVYISPISNVIVSPVWNYYESSGLLHHGKKNLTQWTFTPDYLAEYYNMPLTEQYSIYSPERVPWRLYASSKQLNDRYGNSLDGVSYLEQKLCNLNKQIYKDVYKLTTYMPGQVTDDTLIFVAALVATTRFNDMFDSFNKPIYPKGVDNSRLDMDKLTRLTYINEIYKNDTLDTMYMIYDSQGGFVMIFLVIISELLIIVASVTRLLLLLMFFIGVCVLTFNYFRGNMPQTSPLFSGVIWQFASMMLMHTLIMGSIMIVFNLLSGKDSVVMRLTVTTLGCVIYFIVVVINIAMLYVFTKDIKHFGGVRLNKVINAVKTEVDNSTNDSDKNTEMEMDNAKLTLSKEEAKEEKRNTNINKLNSNKLAGKSSDIPKASNNNYDKIPEQYNTDGYNDNTDSVGGVDDIGDSDKHRRTYEHAVATMPYLIAEYYLNNYIIDFDYGGIEIHLGRSLDYYFIEIDDSIKDYHFNTHIGRNILPYSLHLNEDNYALPLIQTANKSSFNYEPINVACILVRDKNKEILAPYFNTYESGGKIYANCDISRTNARKLEQDGFMVYDFNDILQAAKSRKSVVYNIFYHNKFIKTVTKQDNSYEEVMNYFGLCNLSKCETDSLLQKTS